MLEKADAPAPCGSNGQAEHRSSGPEAGEGQDRVRLCSRGGLQKDVHGGEHDESNFQPLVCAAVEITTTCPQLR